MAAIQAPKGTHDILPAETPAWEWLYRVHRQVAEAHGYGAIETPVFEATEMFARGIGAGTDVVDKEMYSFESRGGDHLTLRPEGTPASLRAVLGAHLDQQGRPVRIHYAGPMFRYDRPQAGRYRQFHQVGVEAIGERTPALDAEVVEMAWAFFEALGITGVSVQINSLGDIDDRRRYREALRSHFLPLADRLCDDCRRRLEINPLRLLDCKRDAGLMAEAPQMADALAPESRDFFDAVLGLLREAAIPCEVNPRLVRGLDYYAHTTFEFWHTSLQGAQNALGGGGRYDGLAEVLGFPATPGVGYALGVERALMITAQQGTQPAPTPAADVVVMALESAAVATAAALARELRSRSRRVVLDGSERKLDKRLRAADRLGARVAVIVGGEELRDGTAVVRDLGHHEQQTVTSDGVAAAVAAVLGSGMGRTQ